MKFFVVKRQDDCDHIDILDCQVHCLVLIRSIRYLCLEQVLGVEVYHHLHLNRYLNLWNLKKKIRFRKGIVYKFIFYPALKGMSYRINVIEKDSHKI